MLQLSADNLTLWHYNADAGFLLVISVYTKRTRGQGTGQFDRIRIDSSKQRRSANGDFCHRRAIVPNGRAPCPLD